MKGIIKLVVKAVKGNKPNKAEERLRRIVGTPQERRLGIAVARIRAAEVYGQRKAA